MIRKTYKWYALKAVSMSITKSHLWNFLQRGSDNSKEYFQQPQSNLLVFPLFILFYQLKSNSCHFLLFLHPSCLAGWASHWAKEVKVLTKETGTNPKRKRPVTKWTQQSYPCSKQTGESMPGVAETQQDTEGMLSPPLWITHLLACSAARASATHGKSMSFWFPINYFNSPSLFPHL